MTARWWLRAFTTTTIITTPTIVTTKKSNDLKFTRHQPKWLNATELRFNTQPFFVLLLFVVASICWKLHTSVYSTRKCRRVQIANVNQMEHQKHNLLTNICNLHVLYTHIHAYKYYTHMLACTWIHCINIDIHLPSICQLTSSPAIVNSRCCCCNCNCIN